MSLLIAEAANNLIDEVFDVGVDASKESSPGCFVNLLLTNVLHARLLE